MNERQDEPVGSLAEELSKLMGTMSGRSGVPDDAAAAHEHVADGSTACRLCPVCQAIAFVRSTSPEVVAHLAASATALASAARGLGDAVAAYQQGQQATGPEHCDDTGVENIDLSEDDSWD